MERGRVLYANEDVALLEGPRNNLLRCVVVRCRRLPHFTTGEPVNLVASFREPLA